MGGYNDLIVIILLGDPTGVEEQLDTMGVRWVTHVDLCVDETLGLTRNEEEFFAHKQDFVDALRFLADDESEFIYVNALANRMAHPLATSTWADMYSDGEYFHLPFMPLTDHETYVDCGACDGDTIERFVAAVPGGRYREIYGLELDYENFKAMEQRLSGIGGVHLYNKGVWSEDDEISYGIGDGDNEPRDGISILKADGRRVIL